MAAELKIGIGADNSGLSKGLRDAEAQITAFVSKVEKIGQIGEQLSSIGQKMSVGLTLPILALGGAAVKTYGDLQSLKMGLEAVMGSANAANSEFEKLREVAKLPGLGLKEAVKGSVALQSAGFSADEARRSLMAFGNALATVGKGANELGLVNLALTQIQNKTGGFGQDLRQLTEQLPQLRGAMQAAFGTVDSEQVQKLGLTGRQVVSMLTAEFEKLPKVTGGIKNAFENLNDNIFISMSRIGKIIDDTFDISGIIDKLTGYLDSAVSAFENLSPAVQKSILVVAGLAAAAGPLLVVIGGFLAALPAMTAGFGAVSLAIAKAGGVMGLLMNPITLVTAGIAGIIALVVANWSKITPYLVRTANNFIQLYNESETFRGAVLGIGLAFEGTYTVIKSFAISAYNTLKSFGKGVLNLFEGVSLMIRGAFNMDGDMISQGWAKANAKVALSFDDLGSRIDGLNTKYKNLFNAGPRKMVTAADFEITSDPEKTADVIANEIQKGAKKVKDKKIKVELPDIEPIAQSTKGFIDMLGNEVKKFWEIDDPLKKVSESFENLPNTIILAGEKTNEAIAGFKDSLAGMADYGNLLSNSLEIAFNSVVNTISDSFYAMGEAMATGGNVLQTLGKTVLAGVGGFLSALGKQLIQYGVAALAMSLLSKLLTNPITAAPAAVAMIAAGAALSAISGAINGTLRGGASSGGGYSSGGVSTGAGGGVANYTSSYSTGTGSNNEFRFVIMGDDLYSVMERAKAKHERLS